MKVLTRAIALVIGCLLLKKLGVYDWIICTIAVIGVLSLW